MLPGAGGIYIYILGISCFSRNVDGEREKKGSEEGSTLVAWLKRNAWVPPSAYILHGWFVNNLLNIYIKRPHEGVKFCVEARVRCVRVNTRCTGVLSQTHTATFSLGDGSRETSCSSPSSRE